MTPRTTLHAAAALLVSGWLAACGGSSGSPDAAPPPLAPGHVDATFGENGIARVPNALYGGSLAEADSLAILPDRRILLSGFYDDAPSASRIGVIARLLPDGALDPAFNGSGVLALTGSALHSVHQTFVTPPVWAHRTFCNDAGSADPQCLTGNLFARRLADGNATLDPAYGNAGTATVRLTAEAVIAAPDASLVVIGIATPLRSGQATALEVARLDPDGRLDAGFGARATAALAIGCPTLGPVAAGRDAEGRMLVAWWRWTQDPGSLALCVVRLGADGSRDPAFGSGGVAVITTIPRNVGMPAALLARADGGSVILFGQVWPPGLQLVSHLLWLTASGQPDPARGAGGFVPGADLGVTGIEAIAQQPDGKILLAGRRTGAPVSPGGEAPRLVRLASDGSIDRGFGAAGDGSVSLSAAGRYLMPRRVATGPDGAIYVAGSVCPAGAACNREERSMGVMRLGG